MIRIILSLTIAFSFIFSTAHDIHASEKEQPVLKIQEVTSKSGLKAWLVEDKTLPIVALSFAFKNSGSAQDPADKQGLAQLASNMMDEGAGEIKSEAFQKKLRDHSIQLRFNASRDSFSGQLKTLSKNAPQAFKLLKLALNEPRFDPEPLERMRNANMSRIRSSLSNPKWIAARIQNDKAFEGHPYAQNSGGTLSTLKNISREDLQAFQTTLSRENLVIAAAGNISPRALKATIENIFGGLPMQSNSEEINETPLQNMGKTFLYEKDIPQTLIEITHPGIDRKDPDYHTAQLMNHILGGGGFGSRLMEEVREKRGLSYGIYSGFIDLESFDGLRVSTSTENNKAADVLRLIKREWEKMTEKPVSEKELKNAKSYLIGALPLSLTSTDKIAATLLSLQLSDLPITYLDDRKKNLQNTTIEDIEALSQKMLSTSSFTTILVGKPNNIRDTIKIQTIPNAE